MASCYFVGWLAAQRVDAEQALEKQARREFDSGDYPAAARDFSELTKRRPGDIPSHILLGLALFRLEKYEDSIRPFEISLTLEKGGLPLSTDQRRIVADQLAMAYGIVGRFEDARSLLGKAIKQDLDYPLNYYNLACLFAEEGNKAQMLANLDLAFQKKTHVLKGEQMPDPRTDSSFKNYVGDADFIALMRKLGFD